MFPTIQAYVKLENGRFAGSLSLAKMRSEAIRAMAAVALGIGSLGYGLINAMIHRLAA